MVAGKHNLQASQSVSHSDPVSLVPCRSLHGEGACGAAGRERGVPGRAGDRHHGAHGGRQVQVSRQPQQRHKKADRAAQGNARPLVLLYGVMMSCSCSLLDVLADRKNRQHVTGHVLLDGVPRDDDFFMRSGYCQQEDILMGGCVGHDAGRQAGKLREGGRKGPRPASLPPS